MSFGKGTNLMMKLILMIAEIVAKVKKDKINIRVVSQSTPV